MLQGITIENLLESLSSLGTIILKLALLYVVLRITSGLFVWIWRTLIVPVFEKRAYFYSYNSEGVFYSERGILGLFRFGRNYRSRINDTLVGYIATKRGQTNENPEANKIYLRKKGREFVGKAANETVRGETICEIYLTDPDEEGGYKVNQNPVGYVDKTGRIFKYYECRDDWKRNERLNKPKFIGQCETPSAKFIGKPFKTEGERSDADVLQYILWEANKSKFYRSEDDTDKNEDFSEMHLIDERRTYLDENKVFQMDDRWFFFRRNWPLFRRVESKEMTNGGAVLDGKRFPYAFLSAKLWRILQVYPTNWPCKAKAWGYGYCTEGFRNPFKEKDDDIPMITRAAAALLLAQKEGFYIGPDEVVPDGVPGAAATALFSLFIYILLFPVLTNFSSYTLFPFLGTEYSSVITLVGLFFSLWLLIINPIRCIIRQNHEWLEAFLELLNKNVGVLGWMSTLVVSAVISLLGSYFIFGLNYIFFPLFLSALIAITVNWAFYHQLPWGISGINEDFIPDDTDEEENEQDESEENNSETEEIEHKTLLNLPAKTINFDEIIRFDPDRLKELRLNNPFRNHLHNSYEETVRAMIEREFSGELYSKILYVKSLVSSYVNKYHLSPIEKVKLIIRICQPDNIIYKHDNECEELYKGFDENNPLLQKQDNKGFLEYCRFPTETIHDLRGDCDCHAAYGAALLAACGFRSCFAVNETHAMCGIDVECTPELNKYRRGKENSFIKDNKTFIILETVGQFDLEEVIETQQEMAEKNDCVIIEPYKK